MKPLDTREDSVGQVTETSPNAADPRLRSRTYAIPYQQVWQAALALAHEGQSGWRVVEADDQEGSIRAEAPALMARGNAEVTIRVRLDRNGQTRVDVRSATPGARADLGSNLRRITSFFRALEEALAAGAQRKSPS